MKNSALLFVSLLMLSTWSLHAQKNKNVAQPELDTGSIEEQFDYILTKSTQYKDFQLIRRTSLLKVKAHTLDSIKKVRKDYIASNQSVTGLNSTIAQLESELATLKADFEAASMEKNNIMMFGSPVSKTSYNTMVWSIIIILVVVLLFFILQFKNKTSIAKRAKNNLDKVENEFEAFRKKSLKKEQEIMRKLQDEINKNAH